MTGEKRLLRMPNLQAVRELRKMTRVDLQVRAVVGSSTISALEKGERGAHRSTAEKLARALGVHPGVLTGEREFAEEALSSSDTSSGRVGTVFGVSDGGAEPIYPGGTLEDHETEAFLEHFATVEEIAAEKAAEQGKGLDEVLGGMLREHAAALGVLRGLRLPKKPRLIPRERMPHLEGHTASNAVVSDRGDGGEPVSGAASGEALGSPAEGREETPSSGIGGRVERLRGLRGLTREELGERTNLSPGYVKLLESGRADDPHVSTVLALASALGASVNELLGAPTPAEARLLREGSS